MTVTAPPRPPRPSDPVDRHEVEALARSGSASAWSSAGLDGDAAMEATETDLEDRRRRLRKMGVS